MEGFVRHYFSKNSEYISTFVVQIALNGLGVISGVFVARGLGPAGRGQLAAAMLWPTAIGFVLGLGLHHAFTYHVASGKCLARELQKFSWLYCVSLTVPVAMGYWLAGPLVLGKQFGDNWWIGWIYCFSVPLSLFAGFLMAIVQGQGDFRSWNLWRLFPGDRMGIRRRNHFCVGRYECPSAAVWPDGNSCNSGCWPCVHHSTESRGAGAGANPFCVAVAVFSPSLCE